MYTHGKGDMLFSIAVFLENTLNVVFGLSSINMGKVPENPLC